VPMSMPNAVDIRLPLTRARLFGYDGEMKGLGTCRRLEI
jgi:hypothetical protein